MDARQGALAFAAGVGVGAGLLWCWTAAVKRRKLGGFENFLENGMPYDARVEMDSLPTAGATTAGEAGASVRKFEVDDILREHLTRNVQFFGLDGQKKIANSTVVVVGLGGVGSHAAHLLLRSGVGRLRLVDFDQVSLSSLNRHCLATRGDVGTPKADCLARHFQRIMPEAEVEALGVMYDDDTEERVLRGRPDFVIDAIDNIDTKVALLAACRRRGLRVLCVAGAGAKADPTRLRFVDVAESAVDPLARAVRHRLRRDHGIEAGLTVLLSTEKPRCRLVYGGQEGSNPQDYQVVPNFRVRTIPVLGTTPAVFGLAAASHVLCELAEAPFAPEPQFRLTARAVQTQYDRLEERERERARRLRIAAIQPLDTRAASDCNGDEGGGGVHSSCTPDGSTAGADLSEGLVGVDEAEVEVLLREVWRGTSARAPHPPTDDRALSRRLGHLALTRWDPSRPASLGNLVLLTREEADAHDAEVGAPGGLEQLRARDPGLCARVEAVLRRAAREFEHSYY